MVDPRVTAREKLIEVHIIQVMLVESRQPEQLDEEIGSARR
jgi:hypothetical protein